jgi:ABC-type branched-subunit amino acid transport system ATPase component
VTLVPSDSTPGASSAASLVVTDVTYSYGSLQVLFGVSMRVADGEIVGLLGTNGAGKSTLLRCITGLATPTGGTVEFGGADITAVPAERIARLGIAFVVGGKANFPDLTVLENLEVGAQMLDAATAAERVDREMSRFPILRGLASQRAGSLSGGEQQQLAIAKALLLDCRLLCIDELSLGLSPLAVDAMLDTVRRVNADGVSVLIVEQSLNVAAAICSRALFLEKGEVRFEGPPTELAERGDLARAVFLGAQTVSPRAGRKAAAR